MLTFQLFKKFMVVSNPKKAAAFAGNARITQGAKPLVNPRTPKLEYISWLVLKKLMGFGSTIIRAFITSKGNATNQKQMPAIPPAASALTFLDLVPHERDSKKFWVAA